MWIAVLMLAPAAARAQQDSFRWVDFRSPADQPVVVWVTRALEAEKWTAIREIGVLYDAALVITTERANLQSPANADTFAIYSVNLTDKRITPLLTGANLRHLDFMRFYEGKPVEPAILYDNCANCAPDTYLTAFYYDQTQHSWQARWMRGAQGVPMWTQAPSPGLNWTQVSAVMAEPNGVEFIATWNHIDFGPDKDPEDVLYRYDRDPWTGLERTQLISGKDVVPAFKQRLCLGQDALPGLAHGQDSELCRETLKPRTERKPATGPPANNRGRSTPPGQKK